MHNGCWLRTLYTIDESSVIGGNHKIHTMLPNVITVDTTKRISKSIFSDTPFKEIKKIDYTWAVNNANNSEICRNIVSYFNTAHNRMPCTRSEFANYMYAAMRATIMDNWEPDSYKIITHSSGYDSRLISSIICDMKKEFGERFIGNILFVECGGEGEAMIEIMKYQGWDESQYLVFDDKDWYIDYNKVHHRLNMFAGYPVNYQDGVIEWVVDKSGRIPIGSKIQIWRGYGINEITGCVNSGVPLKNYLKEYYNHLISHYQSASWITPYISYRVMDVCEKYGWNVVKEAASLNSSLSRIVLKELFSETEVLRYHSLQQLIDGDGRTLPKETVEREQENYNASDFCKQTHIPNTITNRIEYADNWYLWSLAASCDWMLKNNIEVRYAK